MADLLHHFWFLLFATITITSLTATIVRAWHKVRQAEADTALKQAMLQRGLSVEDIERLSGSAEAPLSEETVGRALGECLGSSSLEYSAPALEKAMSIFQAADLPSKRLLVRTLQGIVKGEGALSEEQLLGLIRGLCQPAGSPVRTAQAGDFMSPALR